MGQAEQELDVLEKISQILGDGLELSQLFQRVMALLSDRLHIQQASLVLWDHAADQLRIVASIGLSSAEQQRGRYAVGEGVTGQVLASGEPAVVRDIAKHPTFLNRTGSRDLDDTNATPSRTSFICVPVNDGGQTVGTISIDRPFIDDDHLHADTRLLTIIAGSIAQTIRIHHLIQVEKNQWLEETQILRDNLRGKYKFDNIIGSSPAMLDVLATIGQVASSRATVLLLGETGCGKELIAKAIHFNSPRADHPLIRINCGALSPQLLESELFGHVRGAFTGAVRDKVGRFQAAEGGSIFLDEIGTLDPQLQVKLLRVLQEREFERVGDHKTVKVDARIIAATNLDLEGEVRKGTFREDLYYRLNVVQINLPPLRKRREDIPGLIDFFLDKYNTENHRGLCKISGDVLNTLLRYPWPGNVRELENAMERAVVLSTGEDFSVDLLPLQIRLFSQQTRSDTTGSSIESLAARLSKHAVREYQACEGQVYDLVIGEIEKQLIREALDCNSGIKVRTADFLGINRNTLNKKIKDLGIEAQE